jgi:uncharacterized delta-60 repeat protein
MKPRHETLPLAASCLLVGIILGCSNSGGGGDSAVRINTGQQIVIEDDYSYQTRTDQYGWNTTATVARLEVSGHDFHHGSFRVRAIDAVGTEVLSITYWSWDNTWTIGDNEFYDLRYSLYGVAGGWTVILDFDEFTADLKVSLVDNLNPPASVGAPPSPRRSILDPDFGIDGVVRYTGDRSFGIDVAVDTQGRIVTSGLILDSLGNRRLAVWRFLSNGTFDPSFATGGVFGLFESNWSVGTRLAINPNDAVFVTGLIGGGTGASDIVVVKITSAGILDPSFGTGGVVRIDDGQTERGAGIAIDSGGRIYVAGTSRNEDATDRKILLARLLGDGSADTSFDGDGFLFSSGPSDSCRGLIVDSTVGPTVLGQRGNGIFLLRTDLDGIPAGGFGDAGQVVRAPDSGTTWYPIGLARHSSDGSLAIAGIETADGGSPQPKLAVWLYSDEGQAVTSFGEDGLVTREFSGGKAGGAGVGFDAAGKLLVIGATGSAKGDTAATLWRFDADGTLDMSLASGGMARFDNPPGTDRAVGLGLTVQTSTGAVFATGAFLGSSSFLSTYKIEP